MVFKISVDMLYEFLKECGWEWDKKQLDFFANPIYAKDLYLVNNERKRIRVTVIGEGEKEVDVSPLSNVLVFSATEFGISKSYDIYEGDYKVVNDYSSEWVDYLNRRYGKEYQDYIFALTDSLVTEAKAKYVKEKKEIYDKLAKVSREYKDVLNKCSMLKRKFDR